MPERTGGSKTKRKTLRNTDPPPIPNINEANVNKLHLERSGGCGERIWGAQGVAKREGVRGKESEKSRGSAAWILIGLSTKNVESDLRW